ncbi:hypothetical protein N7462_002543 [Penicillium macrosclerotiorum]|uniref:uncharacterized protein n=1 Tax=Penicillium macrosclerotiorum TaxID=303699 RepID=UPI00254865BC|nr:uncharacterized protein N7462_002543 [Penicillium macrosclerotiorum]KAJ5693120.1 hypothetical protein N7462_002543 [Penicillium macrosclerotiorum]
MNMSEPDRDPSPPPPPSPLLSTRRVLRTDYAGYSLHLSRRVINEWDGEPGSQIVRLLKFTNSCLISELRRLLSPEPEKSTRIDKDNAMDRDEHDTRNGAISLDRIPGAGSRTELSPWLGAEEGPDSTKIVASTPHVDRAI